MVGWIFERVDGNVIKTNYRLVNLLETEDYVEKILEIIYRHIIAWQPPVPINSPSPFFTDGSKHFQEHREYTIQDAREILKSLPEGNLRHGLTFLSGVKGQVRPDSKFLSVLKSAGDLQAPVWYASGFGVEGKQADFSYWAQMGAWSLDEATALSIGFEPIGNIGIKDNIGKVHADVIYFYQRRRKLIETEFYIFGDQTVFKPSPEKFCNWATRVELEIPDKLYFYVGKISGINYLTDKKYSLVNDAVPDLEEREKTSLLRLVIGMAIGGYGFDPTKKRSSIPAEIRSDLNIQGLDLDLDTIRKYLRLAAGILPEGEDSSLDE